MNYIDQIHKGKNDLWRWLLLLGVFFIPFFSKKISLVVINPLIKLVDKDANLQLGVLLFRSVLLLIIFYILFKLLHRRRFITLITGRKKISWYRYFFAFSIWAGLILISFSTSVFYSPEKYIWNFKLYPFLELLFVLLLLVPLYILFNVVLLHGYLYQFFAKVFKGNVLFLIVLIVLISSYNFLQDNFINKNVGYQIIVMYVAINVVTTLSTYLDDGIETILGMRTANTLMGMLYITSSVHPVKQSALFFKLEGPNILLLVYYTALIACPIYLAILSKTYDWDWSVIFNNKMKNKELE